MIYEKINIKIIRIFYVLKVFWTASSEFWTRGIKFWTRGDKIFGSLTFPFFHSNKAFDLSLTVLIHSLSYRVTVLSLLCFLPFSRAFDLIRCSSRAFTNFTEMVAA